MYLKKSKSIVWDSGKIKSDLNLVVFDGKKLLSNTQLSQLSMGMSNDYLEAIDYNSTFVRIGSKIFGVRN